MSYLLILRSVLVLDCFPQIDLSSITSSIFLLLHMPGNFWLDAKHCEFYLLSAGQSYIHINILELCLGIQLSHLEIVWSFQILLFRFAQWARTVLSLGLVIPHQAAKTLLHIQPNAPWILRFSSPASRNRHYSRPYVNTRNSSLWSF